jgi:2-methylaconitate cis-trans-isomerase PrpF
MTAIHRIPCIIIRGGTSKGVFIQEKYLPPDREARDRLILRIFGSPDPRQIDGLGGADPLTSKLAIVCRSGRSDADVDYTFAQVGIETAFVDYSLTCGNICSGVGPFAIDEGLLQPVEPLTTVRIFNTNTQRLIIAEVPVKDGKSVSEGDFQIDGVPGTGAEIALRFIDPAGGITGRLLPTANAVDRISLAHGKQMEVSIVDAGNLYVFVDAGDVGLKGTEGPNDLDDAAVNLLEEIRHAAERLLAGQSGSKKPTFKMAFVARPQDYVSYNRLGDVKKDDIDLTSRIITSKRMHKAYAVTGAIATSAAASVRDSILDRLIRHTRKDCSLLRIGHPSGVIEARAESELLHGDLVLKEVGIKRTARRLMDGCVYVPEGVFSAYGQQDCESEPV